jgi:hypothetical protein
MGFPVIASWAATFLSVWDCWPSLNILPSFLLGLRQDFTARIITTGGTNAVRWFRSPTMGASGKRDGLELRVAPTHSLPGYGTFLFR